MAVLTRRAGVYGANLPTKKTRAVTPADFAIAGLIGYFERKFKKAFLVQSPNDVSALLGGQVDSAQYGWDAVNGFFANTVGVSAKLYILSHVNTTNPVTASQVINSTKAAPEPVLTFSDGYNDGVYQGVVGYGLNGNRTGITITNGDRVTGSIKTTGAAADTFVIVDQPGMFRVGDVIKVVSTGGGGATVYKLITSIDFATSKLNFAGAFHGTASATLGDVVSALGMRVRVWRKDSTGVVSEVDPDLGKMWVSPYAANTDFYIGNVFSQSRWLNVARAATTPTSPQEDFPADIVSPQYPTNGSDGTQNGTLATEFAGDYAYFNNLPIRLLANCETTNIDVQKAMETYCRGRTDNPKVIINFPEAQSKAQLQALGGQYQRTDDVLMAGWDKWLLAIDPFSKGTSAPYRHVPNVGHLMGYIVRIIGLLGIHYATAQKSQPLYGCSGVSTPSTGDPTLDDQDRTDLLNAGVNVIHDIQGLGIIPRNAVTPSTSIEFFWFNGLMMREYIKNSAVESLQESENTPNSLNRVREDKMAIVAFLLRLWQKGSTGNVPTGETFGQYVQLDGTETGPDDHYEVKADAVNNPIDQLNLGNRNLDTHFTYPAPGTSIRIGVGILLKSA